MLFHTRSGILLRKIAGRFDAVRRGAHALLAPSGSSGGLALLASPFALFTGLAAMLVIAVFALVAWLHAPAATFASEAPSALGFALMGTTAEVQKIADEIKAAFEAFKKSNDEQLAEIKAKGTADPLLKAAVDKANEDITKLTAKLHEVEKLSARPQFEGPMSKEQETQRSRVRAFLAASRDLDPSEVEVTPEDMTALAGYEKEMRAYLRSGKVNAAMSVGSQPDGGYLVSPDKSGRIVELVYEHSPMRAHADVQTTVSDAYEGGTDLGEAGSGWVGETEQRDGNTATPQIGEWRIPVHELYAEPHATQKSLDDSIRDPEGWLAKKVAAKFARDEAAAFVNGNGVKKPTGILGYAHASAPTSANWKRIQFIKTGVSADWAASDKGDKIIDLIHTLKSAYRAGAIFFGNTLTIASVRKLKNTNGDYLFQPDVVNGFMGRVHGHPLADFPDMPDIAADSYSLGFGNLKEGYTIVDRLGIRVLRDPLTKKGWVKFYTTKRVGGDVTNFEAIKLLKFGV